MKIGAVPIPINTLWSAADSQHVFNDSRARVLVVSDVLLPCIIEIPTLTPVTGLKWLVIRDAVHCRGLRRGRTPASS